MKYTKESLLKDETIIYHASLHWAVYLPAIFAFICGFVMWLVVGIGSGEAGFGFGIAVFIWIFLVGPVALGCYITKKSSEFCLTNKRVLMKYGFIKRTSFENLLGKVEGITVDQSILGRIFDFGTIIVNGVGGSKIPFPNIAAPLQLRRAVQEQLEIIEKK